MKSYVKELHFTVAARRAFINITADIERCLIESGIQEGLLLCNVIHITASVFINDDESGLHHDYDIWLEKPAPHEPIKQYAHNEYEDNADAHISKGRSWAEKLLSPLPTGNSISVRGNKYFMANSMGNVQREC
jgi:secondary thiamine-phosphate synthase enzyme